MCTLPSDPFVEPFYSLKKTFTRVFSPLPACADGSSINIVRSISAPPILITPSSTIREPGIAMPVTSKRLFNLPVPKGTSITHYIKFAGVPGEGVIERSQQVLRGLQ